jgi:two-component system chemotaxis response regulator CheB
MPNRDIIVVGTSTGGVAALKELAKQLPGDFPASVFVVCHHGSDSPSMLPAILDNVGRLPAQNVRDGDPIHPGRIYVCPPDYHMLLEAGRVRLSHGPRENGFRPAIDPLFRSAARHYGQRVIGVILTGLLSDGVAGLLAVRHSGGLAVVQQPDDAVMADLPTNALAIAGADFVVPLAELAALLSRLVSQGGESGVRAMTDPTEEIKATQEQDMEAQAHGERRNVPSVYSCPECGGTLWQLDDKELTGFRCHVGHGYDGDHLLAEQSEVLEAALWTAVRSFKEQTTLARQLANQARHRHSDDLVTRYEEKAELTDRYGRIIQDYLTNYSTVPSASNPRQAELEPSPPSASRGLVSPSPNTPADGRHAKRVSREK